MSKETPHLNQISNPPKHKSLYFIGIGGAGMSPLAHFAQASGYTVSGSDIKPSQTTQQLCAAGVSIHLGPASENSALLQADTVVYSSAISPDHPELLAARKHSRAVWHRSDLLQDFLQKKRAITIAGTHGKTSTSALITFLLQRLGREPDAIIGGILQGYETSWKKGSGVEFVAEADESDGTFLKYRPDVAVLTNIDADHLNFYGTFDKVQQAFQSYLDNITPQGWAIVGATPHGSCSLGPGVEALRLCKSTLNRLTYGLDPACDFYATKILHKVSDQSVFAHFQLHANGVELPCRLKAFGTHNVLNALAALATVHALGINVAEAIPHLAEYPGVARRLSLLHSSKNLKMIDDYAHNPGKIEACIDAVRKAWPDHHLTVIFQPHRYSRLQTMFGAFASAFREAHEVLVCPVYAAGEPHQDQYHPLALASAIRSGSHTRAFACDGLKTAKNVLTKTPHKKLAILTVGAGDINEFALQLKRLLLGSFQET